MQPVACSLPQGILDLYAAACSSAASVFSSFQLHTPTVGLTIRPRNSTAPVSSSCTANTKGRSTTITGGGLGDGAEAGLTMTPVAAAASVPSSPTRTIA